ncbi:hypothetical protein TSAR_002061 [Trichomalopsis sarcophagae]|uniref:Uncharacterized protein n=1 Tax=Trichomalopsis sarcophagae TaxID=543379 RepID=A0A232F1R1_9HYME|nr:hypothetical protein TSAR_002061 [Trichomalopsis sarcophagae]
MHSSGTNPNEELIDQQEIGAPSLVTRARDNNKKKLGRSRTTTRKHKYGYIAFCDYLYAYSNTEQRRMSCKCESSARQSAVHCTLSRVMNI